MWKSELPPRPPKEPRVTITSLQIKVDNLSRVINDIWWMARRYADGRSSYATSMYNDAARLAQNNGINLHNTTAEGHKWYPDGTPWARDGWGANCSHLTDEEYEMGEKQNEWDKVTYKEEYNQLRKENQELKKEVKRLKKVESRWDAARTKYSNIQNTIDNIIDKYSDVLSPLWLGKLKELQKDAN